MCGKAPILFPETIKITSYIITSLGMRVTLARSGPYSPFTLVFSPSQIKSSVSGKNSGLVQ